MRTDSHPSFPHRGSLTAQGGDTASVIHIVGRCLPSQQECPPCERVPWSRSPPPPLRSKPVVRSPPSSPLRMKSAFGECSTIGSPVSVPATGLHGRGNMPTRSSSNPRMLPPLEGALRSWLGVRRFLALIVLHSPIFGSGARETWHTLHSHTY